MSDSKFEREETEAQIFETQENKKKGEGTEAITASSPDDHLWSTCIRKLIFALAATLVGGTLVYFICRWLIN
ncbi:MAG: hypothetical protein D8M57_17720 [Candidatus Scalindua sp. AMX11]|nr:MAG: hypothetical protein DWQ00_06495 [Candidatus Scalindua sp.]NOG85211.1 hypothetical protein [Planctomycetota bacterium]RZV66142.1 MAG: hypothetical protein EX341_17600 [Candidatus Scalindua sp. SCAELEC01]TDE63549.1 MAG: hypothetical protein D8M57_17720 [Candidatus Scalindua sp. AMX11]GJQ60872.1 MAG: hypothetical protein SCALA701_36730 [Candidatus Scalindua sp.]